MPLINGPGEVGEEELEVAQELETSSLSLIPNTPTIFGSHSFTPQFNRNEICQAKPST